MFAQRDFSRNSAACVHMAGAVFGESRTRVWGPPVAVSGTLRRVAGAAEDGAVADVVWRAACGERNDMVGGQVAGRMGVALVARTPVPMLTTPCPEHSRTQALPLPRAVQGVVAAAVRLPRMLGAPTAGSARDDTANGAELHSPASNGVTSAGSSARFAASALASQHACCSSRGVGVADRSTVARLRRPVAPLGERGRRLTKEPKSGRIVSPPEA